MAVHQQLMILVLGLFHLSCLQQVQDSKSDKERVRQRERERKPSPGELVKSESYRYVRMIKQPVHKVKLIMKGPWADNSLQALLNTYEGELLHSLSHRQIVSILERIRQIEIVYNKTNEKKEGRVYCFREVETLHTCKVNFDAAATQIFLLQTSHKGIKTCLTSVYCTININCPSRLDFRKSDS